jgi:hypothetical protein
MPDSYGGLRRPAVLFEHGKHTEALDSKCEECHPEKDGRSSFAFKRTADPADADALIELYHDECMGCHEERAGQDTGPVICGDCHVERGVVKSTRVVMSFDYSLHGRHVIAEGEKCETCHSVCGEEAKHSAYVKGNESACRDCHLEQDSEGVPSLRRASHDDCVNCHVARAAAGEKTGPDKCVGCHDGEKLAGIETLADPPRIERGQPDWTWVTGGGARANLVPFSHARHEPLTRNCSSCHHKTLEPCSKCHTLAGHADGDGITLEVAYHDPYSERSCVGCHAKEAMTPDCAGCHAMMPAGPLEGSCEVCHQGPEATEAARTVAVQPIPDVQLGSLDAYSPEQLPERVVIDELVDDYGPSDLPHGAIVRALYDRVRHNRLAVHFHRTTDTLCDGCHHQVPAEGDLVQQPACGSCHGKANDPLADKPSLKAAYHRQCVGCHEQMQIEAVDCTACHAEAAKEVSP